MVKLGRSNFPEMKILQNLFYPEKMNIPNKRLEFSNFSRRTNEFFA